MTLLDGVVTDSANQIGTEQIAHIESQKAEIESLKNQLRERDQLIEMLKQKKSRHRIDLSYVDSAIQTLINSKSVTRETQRRLQSVAKEKDQAKKVNGLVEILVELANTNQAAAARMCANVANLAVLLEQLASDREQDESLAQSGRFRLTDRIREFLREVLAQTTEFLGEEPQASALQMNNLDSSQRKKDLERLLSSEQLSNEELRALVLQEMAVSDVIADCLRRSQQRVDRTSPRVSPSKERQAMRRQLIDELTPEIEEKVRAEMAPNRDEIEDDVRAQLEQKLRAEIQDELQDEVENQLKRELKPKIINELRESLRESIEAELEPAVDEELRESLKPQIERELRRTLKPQIERELRETLQSQVEDELRESLGPQMEREKKSMRQQLKEEMLPEIEEEMRASLRPQIEQQMKRTLKPQITDQVREQVEKELRDELEDTIRSELEDEVSGRVSAAEAEKMEKDIRARLTRQLRPQIEKEVREQLTEEMEEEIRRRVDEMTSVIGMKTRRELEELLREEISAQYQGRLERILNEEREKTNRWIEYTLKPELTRQIKERMETSGRQDLEDQISELLSGDGDPELRRRLVEITRPVITREIREEIGSDGNGLTKQQQDALSSVYLALCLASGVNCHDFDLNDFIELAGSLAHEVNEIRESFDVKKGSLFRALLAMKSEIAQLDQYRTHTRSLLVMQSKCISDLRQQTGQASWVSWARKLRTRLLGDDGDSDTLDVAELRLCIEDAISQFVYSKPSREDRSESYAPMTPPSVSRVSKRGKGMFVMPE